MVTGLLIFQIFAGIGGLAGLGAIINIIVTRKKVIAEAHDIAADTSTKMIQNLDKDNIGLRERVKGLEDRETALNKTNHEQRREIENLQLLVWQLTGAYQRVFSILTDEQKKMVPKNPVQDVSLNITMSPEVDDQVQ